MDAVFKVGVVLPTYNGDKWISETIMSVINQTYTLVTLYVIDDGSTDKTMLIVREFMSKYPSKIKIVEKKGVKGAPGSRMDAINAIDDDYIAFIDQDDVWLSDKLEKQMTHIRDTESSLCFTDIEVINASGAVIQGEAFSENVKRLHFNCEIESLELAGNIISYCPIRIGTVLIERQSFLTSGGFDVTLFGGEDWEFWVRYTALGFTISHLRSVTAQRRIHGSNTSYIHRQKRLANWIEAGKKVAVEFPDLSQRVDEFFRLTFYRSAVSCLKRKDYLGYEAVMNTFADKGVINRIDYTKARWVKNFWWVVFPIYSTLNTIRLKTISIKK